MTIKEEFKIIRQNALANPNLYDGRYTQKRFEDAYREYLEDTNILLTKVLQRIKNK